MKLAQNRCHPQENNKDNMNKHKINIGNYLIKKNIYKEIMKLIDKNCDSIKKRIVKNENIVFLYGL